MAIGDIFELQIKGYCAADSFEMVFHYKETTPPMAVVDAAINLAGGFTSAQLAAIVGMQAQAAKWNAVRCLKVFPAPNGPVAALPLNFEGVVVSDFLPVEDAALFTIRTAVGGRNQVGHKYVPVIPEALNNGDNLLTDDASVIAVENSLESDITADGGVWRPVLFNRSTHAATDITQVSAQRHISHQRRRRPKF